MAPFEPGLYPIIDAGDAPDRVPSCAAEIVAGGARILQLRAKTLDARRLLELARVVRALTLARGVRLVVNDRPDIAVAVGADGVHLGQDDLPASAVRPWLPPGMLVGVSCHDLAQVAAATREGVADYLGYGPVYATASKANPDPVVGLEGLAAACRATALPVVAIGGLTLASLPAVRSAGARGAAMIGALLGAPDVEAAVREARARFEGSGS